MYSALFLASVAYGATFNFQPQVADIREYSQDRVWFHLSTDCFADEFDVLAFRDKLLSNYECLDYDLVKRKQIYQHPQEGQVYWSLWFERADDFSNVDCLNKLMTIELYEEECVAGVYFEPLEHIMDERPFSCEAQPTNVGLDLWSLDYLDGIVNNIYQYPDFNTGVNNDVIAIVLDTDVCASQSDSNCMHVEFEPSPGIPDPTDLTPSKGFQTQLDHGTHVAGTMVGHDVGGAKDTELWYYAVCQQGGSCAWSDIEGGYNTAINAMEARSGNNPNQRYVLNYSVGGSRSAFNEEAYNAWGVRINNADGIWVTSAGNSNANACNFAPAFTTTAVTVGAYQVGGSPAWFSNWGACTDVWGPGVLVYSAAPNGQYTAMSGTSMSSPNIANVVINYLKDDNTRDLDDIKTLLIANANNVNGGGNVGMMNQAYLPTCR